MSSLRREGGRKRERERDGVVHHCHAIITVSEREGGSGSEGQRERERERGWCLTSYKSHYYRNNFRRHLLFFQGQFA
jgi:hypothetical protein